MDLLYWFESIRTPFLTGLMSAVTWFGHEILPVVVICIFYWCVNKKWAHKMAFSFFFSGLCVQGLKLMFRIERPWRIDPDFKPVESAIGGATGYSFPSGHTQAATSLYGTLAMLVKKWWAKIVFIVILLLVAVSRLYLGVHTLLDVGVAFGVTVCISVAVCLLYDKLYGKPGALTAVTVFMLVLCAGVMTYGLIVINSGVFDPSAFPYENGQIQTDLQLYKNYFGDIFKTAGAGTAFAIGYFIERKFINFDVKAKNIGWQIVKLLCGVVPALGAYAGLKVLFTSVFDSVAGMVFADFASYFILVIWVIAIYPAVFKRIGEKRSAAE